MKLNFYIARKKTNKQKPNCQARENVFHTMRKKIFPNSHQTEDKYFKYTNKTQTNVLIINSTIKLGCGAINNW